MERQSIEFETKLPPKYTVAGGLKLSKSVNGDKHLNPPGVQRVSAFKMSIPPIVKTDVRRPKG